MPDKVYEIKITTPADLTGAQATQAALTGIAQQAEQVTASAGAATVGVAGAAEATGRFTDAAGKVREANGQFVATGKSAQEAGGHIAEASHEADHFIASLKAGVGIDLGHRLIEGIAEVPAAFKEAISEGVRFNQTMESLGIQLGAALRSASPERYLNFSSARADGVEALEAIRVKANELGTDVHGLAETLAVNIPVLAKGGIKDIHEQLDAILLLNQAAAAKGIQDGFQRTREIIDILNGQGNRTILGKELEQQGLTPEAIKQAEQMGTLMDLLREKLGAYGEAGRAAADTFTAAQQRLKNETEQLYGEISKPVFDALKDAYRELAVEIEKPEVRDGLRAVGYDVATIVSAGAGLLRWAVDNAGALTTLGEAVGVAALAWAAFKAASVVGTIGGRVAEWVAETVAIGENTVALETNVVARNAKLEAEAASAAARMAEGLAPEAGSLGGAISAAEAEATGAAIGAGVSTFLQGAAALAIGTAVGYAISSHLENVREAALVAAGDESNSRTQGLKNLRDQIGASPTEETQTKLRRELQERITKAENDLAAKKEEISKEFILFGKSDPTQAQTAAINGLETYLTLARRLNDTFSDIAGKRLPSNPLIQRDQRALQEYYDSPAGMMADAEQSGDEDATARAKWLEGVEKRKKKLMSGENPLGEKDAQREAENQESGAEKQKDDAEAKREDEKSRREKERDDARAQRENESAAKVNKNAQEALADATERAAINEARAAGHEDEADELQRQHDIREATLRLQKGTVTEAQAHAVAEREVNAAIAERNQKEADRDANRHHRPPHEERHHRGERDSPPITGYRARPGDAGYAGADTDGYVDRFGGKVPASPVAPVVPRLPLPDLLPRGYAQLAAQGIGLPTAAASLAPVLDSAAAASAAAADTASAPDALTVKTGTAQTGNDPLTRAADKFGRSADEKFGRAGETIEQLTEEFGGVLDLFNGRLATLRQLVNTALSQNANES